MPRGLAVDLADVTVYNKNGAGTLRRGYQYLADLRITSLTPPTGPINVATTAVVIAGAGFTGATSVKFGALSAPGFSVDSDTQISVSAPSATAAGAVDVSIVTPRDSWVAKRAFTYFDPAGAFALFSVVPHVASPGDTVTLTGQDLATGALNVTIGGVAATVGARTFSTAQLTVPARGAAPRQSDVVGNSATLTGGFTFRLGVLSIAPAEGPAAGGTSATLTGSALPADAVIQIGALAATGVTVTGETQATLTTPRGAGGAPSDIHVNEGADPENEALLPRRRSPSMKR